MTELWKKMTRHEHKPKYENSWYEISNIGRIRRWLNNKEKKEFKYLKGFYNKEGYKLFVCKKKQYMIHRMVLIYFVGPPPEDKPNCDHKNRIRDDNRLKNLHWVSSYENNMNRIDSRKDIKEFDKEKRKNLIIKLNSRKKKYKCVCGGINSTAPPYKKRHELTKKHKKYITNIGKTLVDSN